MIRLLFVALLVGAQAGCGSERGNITLPLTEADGVRSLIVVAREPNGEPAVFAANVIDGFSLPLEVSEDAALELLYYRCPLSAKGYSGGAVAVTDVGQPLPDTSLDFRLQSDGTWARFEEPSEGAASLRTGIPDQTGCPSFIPHMRANAPDGFGWATELSRDAASVDLLGSHARIIVSRDGITESAVTTAPGRILNGIKATDGRIWFTTTEGILYQGTIEGGFSVVSSSVATFTARFAEVDETMYLSSDPGLLRATPEQTEVLVSTGLVDQQCDCTVAIAADGRALLYAGAEERELFRYDLDRGTPERENLDGTNLLGPISYLGAIEGDPVLGTGLGFLARLTDSGWRDLKGPEDTNRITNVTSFQGGLYVGSRFSLHYVRPDGQLCEDFITIGSSPRSIFPIEGAVIIYSIRDNVGLVDIFDTELCQDDL